MSQSVQQPSFTAPYPFKWSRNGKCYTEYDLLGGDIKSKLPRTNNAEFTIDRYHLNVWQTNQGKFLVFCELLEQYEAKKKQRVSRVVESKWLPKERIVEVIETESLTYVNSQLAENNGIEFHAVLSVGDRPRYYLVRVENIGLLPKSTGEESKAGVGN